jgi:hypothetical protein
MIAGVATVAASFIAGTALGRSGDLRDCLASVVKDRESYRRVGLLCRRTNPEAVDAGELRRQFGEPSGHEPLFLLSLSVAQRRRWFIDRCRRDFEQGNVELVDGWLFAASELRLAVLLAA